MLALPRVSVVHITLALAPLVHAGGSQLPVLDAPEVSDHGNVTAAQIKAGIAKVLRPECDFTGDSFDFNYIAFNDGTCFGWNNVRKCHGPWNLCDTALALFTMDEQTSVEGPVIIAHGDWKGSFEGKTTSFKMQDISSFEEAIVLANGHNEPMAFSTKSLNAMEWKEAAGASTYYWGANEGSVASITRIGNHMCDPTPESACEKLGKEQ